MKVFLETEVEKKNILLEDFDFGVRRFLYALYSKLGSEKLEGALENIQMFTCQKPRSAVKNWPAYLLSRQLPRAPLNTVIRILMLGNIWLGKCV